MQPVVIYFIAFVDSGSDPKNVRMVIKSDTTPVFEIEGKDLLDQPCWVTNLDYLFRADNTSIYDIDILKTAFLRLVEMLNPNPTEIWLGSL